MRRKNQSQIELVLQDQGDSVWRLVVRLLGESSHDAADCFQQAFVQFADQPRPDDLGAATALLKRIATARAIDLIRRRIRERSRLQVAELTTIPSQRDLEPEVYARANELVTDLREALVALPERQSAVFVLTQVEGVSNEEAAAALGMTTNHVGVLLHRARAALRVALASHQPTGDPQS